MAHLIDLPVVQATSPDEVKQRTKIRVPCVFRGVLSGWPDLARWSPTALADVVGARRIDVEAWPSGPGTDPRAYLRHRRKITMTFSRFATGLMAESHMASKLYLAQYPVRKELPELDGLLGDLTPYQDYVRLPAVLQPRALFEPVLFMGPANSFTPIHYDLNRTFLAQMWGRKRVSLISHRHWRQFGLPASGLDARNFSPHTLEQITADPDRSSEVGIHEGILQPGDMLYIPYGWLHYVGSTETSVSLTYGWCSADDLGLAGLLRARRRLSWTMRGIGHAIARREERAPGGDVPDPPDHGEQERGVVSEVAR